MKRLFFIAGLAALTPAAAMAQPQQCTIQSFTSAGVTTVYNPINAAATIDTVPLTLNTAGCGNRNIPVRLESVPGGPVVVQGTTLTLRGSDANNPDSLTAELSDGRGRGAIVIDLNRDTNPTVANLRLAIAPGQRVRPGTYAITLNAVILPNGGNVNDTRTTTITIVVNVAATIGLAPATGTELYIPEIVPGATAQSPVTFRAYSNIRYRLTLSSDYQLRMRRSASQSEPNVPYAVLLDGTAVTTSGTSRTFDLPASANGFRTHELNVEVPGSLSLRPAGTYRDMLTVEISPAA